jgi:predicted amidophosphoribosyltransferase
VHPLVASKAQMISFESTTMSTKTCRDCGNVLEEVARGCPRCALNFEAENMIDRFILRRVVPGLLLVVLGVIAVVYYWYAH